MRIQHVTECEDCGEEHLGRCGSLSFAERIRTVQIPASVTPTKTLKAYYDSDSLNAQLGGTAKERQSKMENDSNGLGAIKNLNGRPHVRDRRSKEVRPLTEKEQRSFL